MRSRLQSCAVLFVCAALYCSCKTTAPAPIVVPPPVPALPLDTRVSWILRLEQQRVLRDAGIDAPAAAAGARSIAPARTPDLTALLTDTDAAVRRRAALAIGRVGSTDGVAPLAAALSADSDADVRAMAAFALGLIGARMGAEPLTTALSDASIVVRSRAVEGLGLIGDPSAADAIANAAPNCRQPLSAVRPDDEEGPKTPEVELCRLALYSLVRLKQFDQLAKVALDPQGQPVSTWWPVAYALQRIGDKRAVPALIALANTDGVVTPAFALRGLGELGEKQAAPLARSIAMRANADVRLRVAAVRALGQTGDASAVDPLIGLALNKNTPRNLAIEAVTALGALGDPRAFDPLLDLVTDGSPAMRAAVLASLAKTNPDSFLLVVSGLTADPDWSVRAALASVFGTLPADQVRTAVVELTNDSDARVVGPALRALAKVGAPDLTKRLFEAVETGDFVIRATAADLIGQTKPEGGVEKLIAAYNRGESDSVYASRAAAIEALATYGTDAAKATIRRALEDKSWPVRWRAAELLRAAGDATATAAAPAPLHQPAPFFESTALLHPTFTPHVFLDTRLGSIEVELDLVNAPVTSLAFVDLARTGFFNGLRVHRLVPNFVIQVGDPRGDGEGGPGFTLMDELSPAPFVRGSVGLALDWRDTGGSQFFITLSPQPHLDAKYTVFGRVVSGDELLDRISQWDVIDRVRIWDGVAVQ
jgi:HEAT repeat protein/cyclophilin family peptidyl-prolyl cis-trans isomerase